MCIKILGDKNIRGSKVIIFKIKNNVFKIPLVKGAIREMRDEKERVKRAKNDIFFSHYLPAYKFILVCQISPYLRQADKNFNFDFLIREYFKKSFEDISEWGRVELGKLVNECFLEFVSKYAPEDLGFCNNYLKKIILPFSPAHGDFHPENILAGEDQLYFIDWSRYSDRSSRYFDLYDYYIFSKKNKGEQWISTWEKELKDGKDEILGVKVKKEYLLAYGIWKASEDVRILELRNKFDKFKIKKYINFIKILKELNIQV